MAQEIPQDLAVWIADVVQIQTLSRKRPISDSDLKLIEESADRLMNVLEGRLTPDLIARMTEVAQQMALAIAA